MGNFFLPISVTLGQGHQATEVGQILLCPHSKVRTGHLFATRLGRYIPLVMLSTWLNFGGILSETFFNEFFHKISGMGLPSRSNLELAISQPKMVWLPRNKKQTNRLNARPQMRSSGLTLAMTLTLNFQGQILNLLYLSQKWFDCHETKSKHIDWTPGLKWDHRVWP